MSSIGAVAGPFEALPVTDTFSRGGSSMTRTGVFAFS